MKEGERKSKKGKETTLSQRVGCGRVIHSATPTSIIKTMEQQQPKTMSRPLRSMCFCGPPNSGKKTALFDHLLRYFDGDEKEMRRQTMVVNCIVDPPGPDFVCSVLRPFASFACAGGARLRAVVFLYADHLGVDAQTALRRCMELHSTTTRFFLVMYDDGQLIAPIRSRLRTRRFQQGSCGGGGKTAAAAAAAAVAGGGGGDAIDALERDLCVRQATWSGLGHLFAASVA